MQENFRLQLNQSWEAVDIQTGAAVVIPKGSHKAVRILHRAARDAKEEPWLVVTIQHQDKSVAAGLREAYWRQWERLPCSRIPCDDREMEGELAGAFFTQDTAVINLPSVRKASTPTVAPARLGPSSAPEFRLSPMRA
jgi:hypothetical protein